MRAGFLDAAAHSTEPADPALFGPNAPKVKGGTDLVGDDYDADPSSPTYQPVPHPDANPLDCNGHGSHVAGTVAGLGVKADGTTYAGPFDATTYATDFRIGPGVAPKARIFEVSAKTGAGMAAWCDYLAESHEARKDQGL